MGIKCKPCLPLSGFNRPPHKFTCPSSNASEDARIYGLDCHDCHEENYRTTIAHFLHRLGQDTKHIAVMPMTLEEMLRLRHEGQLAASLRNHDTRAPLHETTVTTTTTTTTSACHGCIFGVWTCSHQRRPVSMWCAFCLRQRLYPDFSAETMCPRVVPSCYDPMTVMAACPLPPSRLSCPLPPSHLSCPLPPSHLSCPLPSTSPMDGDGMST